MQTFFEEFWVSVSIPFQVFGLTSVLVIPPKNAVHANLLFFYNLLIASVVGLIILVTFLNDPNVFDESINVIIDHLLLYAFLFTHLIIIIESNATTDGQKLMYVKLHRLTEIFRKKLHHKIKLHPLQVKCLQKIWFSNLLPLLAICIVAGTLNRFWKFFGRSVFCIIVARLRLSQISIYVDILTEYFCSLRNVLHEMTVDPNLSVDDKIRRLIAVKDVCGNLIDVNDLIANNFGWSMTAIFAQNFFDMLSRCYWTFMNIYSLKSWLFGISKFIEGMTTFHSSVHLMRHFTFQI